MLGEEEPHVIRQIFIQRQERIPDQADRQRVVPREQ